MVQYIDDSHGAQSTANPLATNQQRSVRDSKKADESRDLHLYSDVDVSPTSQHHTIGKTATQVAAGNHRHDSLYPSFSHTHDPSDIVPPIFVPDEVIVSGTDPFVIDPTLPDDTLWIDDSIPDATFEAIGATWGTDKKSITTTTFAHPANWGTLLYVAPADGFIYVKSFVEVNANGLLNSRWAQWRMRILDSTDALVKGHTSQDPRTQVYTWQNEVLAPVVAGETYKISLQFALSHANGTTFDVSDPTCSLMFWPEGQYAALVLTTEP